jgi:hypothetical protein
VTKLQNTAEKLTKVAELKEKWAKEREAKRLEFEERRKAESRLLSDSSIKAAKTRRKASIFHQSDIMKRRELEREMIAASNEERTQLTDDLLKLEKKRRRKSVMINKKILIHQKQKEAEISQKRKELEDNFMETKRIDYLQAREAKRAEEECRRESLFERGRIAVKQKTMEADEVMKKKEEEKGLMEFRKHMWKAKHEKLNLMAERRLGATLHYDTIYIYSIIAIIARQTLAL